MSLLHEIQQAIVQEGADLGSILLKLRLLASRLGSGVLEEWVKHESEGYPKDAELPAYRVVAVSYKGTFFGPFNAQIRNAPIPTYLIQKIAGDRWVNYKVRQSIAAVDATVRNSKPDAHLGFDASDLMLLLQGKIYEDYACNAIDASISLTAFYEIVQAVRGRVLELTLQLERSVPGAAEISFGAQEAPVDSSDKVQQISQQIIYGNVTNAVSASPHATISSTVVRGDAASVVKYLAAAGISEEDAAEFASILEAESPKSVGEPFGEKAESWVTKHLRTAAGSAWKAGVAAAGAALTKAALAYYGIG